MAKPRLVMLSQEEKDRIHDGSLTLLEKVGLRVMDGEAIEVLAGSGARVDRATQRVRLPAALVEGAVRQAPSELRLYGRDIADGVALGPGHVYYTTNGYAVAWYDPETRTRRPITGADLAWLTRLSDAMDQVDLYSVLATPCDVPPETNDRHQFAIALQNTTRHIWNTAYGPAGVRDAVAMGVAVRGAREALREYPLFTLDLTTLSPLELDERQASTMVEGAKQGLPIGISPGPIAGATGPVTLAGTLAQANAEVLGAITLCELVSPGLPVIYTQYTRSLDMSTGGVTMGGPEFSLLRVATAEMAAYYHLPARGGGMIADAKACDAQMGAEKMLNCLMASLAGLTVLAGVGLVDSINTVRPDQMVIDNEIIRVVRRALEGFALTEDSLALDVIAEVGPGGNYLAHDHTAARFREELWFTRLWDRRPWSVWEEQGAQEVAERAWQAVRGMGLEVPPLPEAVRRTIEDVVQEADRRRG